MTMVPAQNYSFPTTIGETIHGVCLASAPMNRISDYHAFGSSNFSQSDSPAALRIREDEVDPSYSKSNTALEQEQEERDGEWLRLGIGHVPRETKLGHVQGVTKRGNLVELDLLHDKPGNQSPPSIYHSTHLPTLSSSPHVFLQNQSFLQIGFKQPDVAWSFRPISDHWKPTTSTPTVFPAINAVRRSNLKLVDAPSRPQSGLWFMLQAAQNQSKEPVLPQLARNYLRIKDGKATVLLLMKYLANKLELDSELEIEITCRGRLLVPSCTLRHARDAIWCSRGGVVLPQGSPTHEHIMILNYARNA